MAHVPTFPTPGKKGTTTPTRRGLGLSRKVLKRYLLGAVGLVVAAVNLLFLWPSSSSSSSSPFLSLLSSPRSSTSWWEAPPHITKASHHFPLRRRRVVMCAFDDSSLRLAWTQIQILRSLSSEAAEATKSGKEGGVDETGTPQPTTPVPVIIYHVAELHASTEYLARVQALGGVDVVDLAPWLSNWTSLAFSATGQLEEQEEKIYLKYYQGFLCKAVGLLHAAGAAKARTGAAEGLEDDVLKEEVEEKESAVGAVVTEMTAQTDSDSGSLGGIDNSKGVGKEELDEQEELVAVLDLEVILFHDPFSLAETPIFQQTGAYLFSDRRLSRGKEVASFREYQQVLKRLYNGYRRATTSSQPLSHSEQTTVDGIPVALADSSIFQGWSWDYGESALLIFDVQRHASTGFLDALQYLLRVDSPTFRTFAYGDKELYWLALVLAGEPLQMNPWIPTAVGALEEVQATVYNDHRGRQRVCSWFNALAQATPTHGLFYLNGEGPELSTVEGDRFLLDQGHLSAAKPIDLRERDEGMYKERNMCTAGGGVPLPGLVKAQLHAYRTLYLAFNETSAPDQALLYNKQ